jgi:two-component system response regulator HydG
MPKENKSITGVADNVIQAMLNYDWPGNIRELQNLMARSVLLTSGPIINTLRLPGQSKGITAAPLERIKTMIETERDHILFALERCNWKIYGQGGAADLLELNPSTLNSRIKKLGIGKKYARTSGD